MLRNMTVPEWRRAISEIRDEFYDDIVDTIGCGPFDGGCVVVAHALQRVLGGEIYVVTRADGSADHAAVLFEGRLWDWDGPALPSRFIERFNRNEMASTVSYRPYASGDLIYAAGNDALVDRISILIRKALRHHQLPQTPEVSIA